jgi:hypothetical protein
LRQSEKEVDAGLPFPENLERFSLVHRFDHFESRKVGGILETFEISSFMGRVVNH